MADASFSVDATLDEEIARAAEMLAEARHVVALTGADRTAPDAVRVVAMGDSCTFFGSPPYPGKLEQSLAR